MLHRIESEGSNAQGSVWLTELTELTDGEQCTKKKEL